MVTSRRSDHRSRHGVGELIILNRESCFVNLRAGRLVIENNLDGHILRVRIGIAAAVGLADRRAFVELASANPQSAMEMFRLIIVADSLRQIAADHVGTIFARAQHRGGLIRCRVVTSGHSVQVDALHAGPLAGFIVQLIQEHFDHFSQLVGASYGCRISNLLHMAVVRVQDVFHRIIRRNSCQGELQLGRQRTLVGDLHRTEVHRLGSKPFGVKVFDLIRELRIELLERQRTQIVKDQLGRFRIGRIGHCNVEHACLKVKVCGFNICEPSKCGAEHHRQYYQNRKYRKCDFFLLIAHNFHPVLKFVYLNSH